MHGELFEFTTADGATLHAFLTRHGQDRTCLLYVHGMRDNFYASDIAAALRETSSFCSINTRGHDMLSRIDTTKGRRTVGTAVERFAWCEHDIAGAIAALKKLGFRSFILVGHSTGCQKVVYYQYRTKDPAVRALVLLAPVDDHNYERKRAGKRWLAIIRKARDLGDDPTIYEEFDDFCAKRFLSIADLKNVEGRLFNYDGPLREFASLRTPILAVFGRDEEYAVKPVAQCLEILAGKSRSKRFSPMLVQGSHSFEGHERILARAVARWLARPEPI